jgi:hypothetical protein
VNRSSVVLCTAAVAITLLSGCESTIHSPESGLKVDVVMKGYDTSDDTTLTFDLAGLPKSSLEGREAVSISEMIPASLIPKYDNKTPDDPADDIDRHPLFGYRLVAVDGFSAHVSRGADDLRWSEVLKGYLYTDTRNAVYDASLDMEGMHRVKNVSTIEIYRVIDVVLPDTSWRAVVAEAARTTVDGTSVVMLSELLSGVTSPESFTYTITAVDEYSKTLTWEQVQSAYYLPETDQVNYTIEMTNSFKLKNLMTITAAAQ